MGDHMTQKAASDARRGLPIRPTMPGGVADHLLALHALNVLRAELRNMTFRTAVGEQNNLQVAGQSLDMVESIIKHHAAYQRLEAERNVR